jgi:hypothetical protein
MKVYISNYRYHWYSPYTWIDYAFFWTDWSKCSRNRYALIGDEKYIEHPAWVDKVADFLNPISVAIQTILDKIHPPIRYVKIDRWDTWSMDSTLAHIILPMLKQLRDTKHGSPYVDLEDVPEELRVVGHEDWDTQKQLKFENQEQYEKESWEITHRRWEWILNEMIFAFEHIVDDTWKESFSSGEIDMLWVPVDKDGNEVPKGEHSFYRMEHGPKHTHVTDYDAMQKVEDRIQNGLRLFGKYYRGLWD